MDDETLFEEIAELVAAPRAGTGAPALAHMEDTLTAGYARALALEAERWRLERRMGELAASLDGDRSERTRDELASLSSTLTLADGELSRLRALLETLRVRASDLRLAESRAC